MTIEEQINVMQAYASGKKIQFKDEFSIDWIDLNSTPSWNWADNEYRIKPESKYVPYKDTSEMIEDYCNRFDVERKECEEPIIWIAKGNVRKMIYLFSDDYVTSINANEGYFTLSTFYMRTLFCEYTYLDGSPVGKLVEE